MDNLPQEILRDITLRLDIKSIINLSQSSKFNYQNNSKFWISLLREQAIALQPQLGLITSQLNWKTIALHAFYTSTHSKPIGWAPQHLAKFLATIRGESYGNNEPVKNRQKAIEVIRDNLNNTLPVVQSLGFNSGACMQYRAPLLYWICHSHPRQEDTEFIEELALDEVLTNTAAVNVPALNAWKEAIDWPINAAILQLWTHGVKRLLQVEGTALDVRSTVAVDDQQLRVSPLHCVILAVTSHKLFHESDNLTADNIDTDDGYRFISHNIHRTINLSKKVLPVRQRGLEILQSLLTRVNPNQPTVAMTASGNRLLARYEDVEESGFTALHLVCYYQAFGTWIDGIKALIEAGADVNAQSTQSKLTPLHMLFANIQHMNTRWAYNYWSKELELSQLQAVVELFLAHGADLSLTTSDGMNVIHYALVAHKHMSFDQSLITLMQQHCASAASVSLPWSVCMRCKKRYDVNGNNSTACAIHTENFDECAPFNNDGSDTYPCCGGEEDSRGCSLAYHQ